MTTTIAVLNKSTLLSDADASTMASACQFQVTHHLAPLSARGGWKVIFFGKGQVVPPVDFQIVIMDDPDQANALGYHTEDPDGKVWGRVFVKPVLDNGGSALKGALSVSAVLSHEVCETFCDKSVNMWVDRMDGTMVALEVCDPVENDSYTVTVTAPDGSHQVVSVSNFVTYAWFDKQAPAGSRFDFLHNVHAPLTMSPGGYMVVMDVHRAKVTEVFGSTHGEEEHKKKKPHHVASRTARRHGSHGDH